jgi:Arm DNA-binding domain
MTARPFGGRTLGVEGGGQLESGGRAKNMKLTDLQVRSAKPTDKKYKLADGGGLYLLVSPNGSKLWHYKFRVAGKEKLMAFGPYPDVTIAKARDLHHRARKALDGGVDPIEIQVGLDGSVGGGEEDRGVARVIDGYISGKPRAPTCLFDDV